jgi:polysaccharide pyruvyl transferase CsaB
MTRRIVISGYYGFNNLGDEAVLAATVAALRDRVPQAEIAVLSAAPGETSRVHGVAGIPRDRPREVAWALRGSDLFLSGGGSLFQDATSWRSPWYYLGILLAARRLARHTAVYAQGIERPRRPGVRAAMRRVLNAVELITVRDRASLDVLAGLGVRRPRTALCADPSLLLTPDWSAAAASERAKWETGRWFGLALRSWGSGAAVRAAAAAAATVAERRGIRWALLPMHPPGDLATCEALASHLGPAATVVRAPLGPREMLALVGTLDLLVGMRLHALLFAAAQGVPIVPIIYDPKIAALARELDEPPPLPADGLRADALVAAIESADEHRGVRRARISAAAARLRERAALAPALVAGLLE